jgi:hypothetical protein
MATKTKVPQITAKHGSVDLTIKFIGRQVPTNSDKDRYQPSVNTYRVICKNGDAKFGFKFFDSIHCTQTKDILHDNLVRDIMSCIKSDYYIDSSRYPTFNDFCSEFGYDNDSRKAERTYKACLKHAAGLQSVFTSEIIEGIEN